MSVTVEFPVSCSLKASRLNPLLVEQPVISISADRIRIFFIIVSPDKSCRRINRYQFIGNKMKCPIFNDFINANNFRDPFWKDEAPSLIINAKTYLVVCKYLYMLVKT